MGCVRGIDGPCGPQMRQVATHVLAMLLPYEGLMTMRMAHACWYAHAPSTSLLPCRCKLDYVQETLSFEPRVRRARGVGPRARPKNRNFCAQNGAALGGGTVAPHPPGPKLGPIEVSRGWFDR